MSNEISHVSDTALMAAACRAIEFDAPDAFVRDRFAARLAGQRGMAILEAIPHREMMRFGIAVRSRFIDELLMEAVGSVETVLSVGSGLDARPWRLELPPDLRWIEVDFADILDYKHLLLSDEKPKCLLERITADLTDAAQRRAVYEAAGEAPALMITEGLLMYLPALTVDALAEETWRASGIRNWIADLTTSAFAKAVSIDNSSLRHVQASDHLQGEEIYETILRHGWASAARRSYITDMAFAMERAARMMAGQSQRPEPPAHTSDPTGVHRFARA